jgi:hypothetical protein
MIDCVVKKGDNMDNIILNYLKDNNYDVGNNDSNGINIELQKDEVLIKGSKQDLIELSNYILNIALSSNDKDHIHLDDLTVVNESSKVKSIIIEKE